GGVVLALDNPLRRSFVSEMVPEKDVPNAVVLYSTIINLSRVFGPSIAGVLVVTLGYGWCFTIDAASYIAVIACIAMMRVRELYVHPPAIRKKSEIRAGMRYVMSKPKLWIAFVMLALIGTLSYNFSVTLPLFVARGLHATDTTYTVLFTVMGAGSVVAALFVAHKKLVKIRHAVLGAGALGLAILILAVSGNIVMASIVTFFIGVASIIYSTSTTALVQLVARPQMRGRVLALQTVLLMGTTPIGGPLLGWLADAWGGRAPLIVGGCAAIAAAGLGYYFSREHIKKPQPVPLQPQPIEA
ncbi:MAG TPA: MFS transporter, partial [Candidatus Saccharimonadaceae bacterium]|nr:MFS transporter [Candidatus Saccharimonadaceae bacterium]